MPMKRNGWLTVLAVFLVSSLAAGCVQGVHSAGEREGPVEDALTGERLVTVRIPVNAAVRALTLELARDSIDFYEVAFKHTDGRTFSASATINRELSIVLPVGTYETVLLAGTYNSNTLLASAYEDSVDVDLDTTKITYKLKALDTSVNKVEFKYYDYDIYASTDTTPEGLPYIPLDYYIWDGTITIGNFPHAAIFDPVLVKNNRLMDIYHFNNNFEDDLYYRMAAASAASVIKEYDNLYRKASALAAKAEDLSSFNDASGADTYVEAARAAGYKSTELGMWSGAYGELSQFVLNNMGGLEDIILINITWLSAILDQINSSDSTAAAQAWTEAYNAFNVLIPSDPTEYWYRFYVTHENLFPVGNAYREAIEAVDQDWSGSDIAEKIEATKTARKTFEDAFEALNLPTGEEFLVAAEKLRTAITVTTGVSVGSFDVLLDVLPAATILDMGGYIDFANEQYPDYDDLIAALKQGESITPTVEFSLDTLYATEGYAAVYFDFAFKPFGSSRANTWHIKGGLNNRVIDDGSGIGGGILLKVEP
jgi:hypothetical protein